MPHTYRPVREATAWAAAYEPSSLSLCVHYKTIPCTFLGIRDYLFVHMKHLRYIITNIDITTIHDIYSALLLNHLLARRLGSAVARGGFQLSNPISPCVPHTLSTKTPKRQDPAASTSQSRPGTRANVLYPSVAAQTTWTLYGKWMHPLLYCVLVLHFSILRILR